MKYRVEGDFGISHFVGNDFTRIPAGSSARFLVARTYLTDKDIYVPFLYDWDNQPEMFDDANRIKARSQS